jgi:hypothetical protein
MEGEEEYGIGNLGRYVKRSLGRYVFDGGKGYARRRANSELSS